MAQQRSKLGPTHEFTFISKNQSCKRYFFEVFKYKCKILLRNVFEILLSNTSTLRPKIQYTKYLFAIVFEIQNTQVRSYNTQLVNARIGFEEQKCFEHVRQFVAFRAADNAAKAKQAFDRGR